MKMENINSNRLKRRGLVWTFDFIIGLMLFLIIIFVAVKMALMMYPSQEYNVVYRDAVYLSDNLISQGYPANWTATDVILPGIADENRIDMTKLSEFKNLEYYHAKTLLHVTSDFIFFISNSTSIINTGQCVYGYNLTVDENCTPQLSAIYYDDLVKINRLILYNSTVKTLTIYAWD